MTGPVVMFANLTVSVPDVSLNVKSGWVPNCPSSL